MITAEDTGKRVVLTGRVARIPWQHLVRTGTGKDVVYVDLDDGGQIVAYAEGGLECDGRVMLEGTVIETGGKSKRPGSRERYAEYQLDVLRWERIE